MSGAILVKRTTSGALPVNAPAGTSVGTLSPYYIQGEKYDLGSSLTGSVAIDLTDQDVIRNQFSGTLVGNVTFAFTSPPAPMAWHVHLAQNATGLWSVGWPAGVVWLNSAGAPRMPPYPNEEAIFSFLYDGSEITGTMSQKGYPRIRQLFMPHAQGIHWSNSGVTNPNCNIVGGADTGLPDGTYLTVNMIRYTASAGHYFTGRMHWHSNPVIQLGGSATALDSAGSPTQCISIASGGTVASSPVTDSVVMYGGSFGGGICLHLLTSNNKTLKLAQGVKASYTGGGAWSATTLAQFLADHGFLDAA